MTSNVDTIPQPGTVWERNDRTTVTVTELTTINNKPNVAYEVGAAGAGVADLDYFLKHHTEVTG
ncbi:hypothetical protein AB0K35_27695 [Micromonospora sp. NPDC053740]|uniref:hypothetical protein n=1 Tax=Micromonospora sp. NPDC053740 TaxID=3155173 RepID=UPI0034212389